MNCNRLLYDVAPCPASLLFALLVLGIMRGMAAADEPANGRGVDFFEQKIRPVLVRHCYKCHSGKSKSLKGGLRLDTRAGLRRGGDNGPALVPGKANESLLLSALQYEDLEMPPDGKLPGRVIADFETWIKLGAPDPRDGDGKVKRRPKMDIAASRSFWSFQQPKRMEPPHVADEAWVRRPMDAFILARLESQGLKPNPLADRRTLIRRVTFDLTGLPPTPEDVEAFVNDRSANAYEQLVERLLASDHYGERWARMWLDVARYAEDQAHIVGDNKSLFYPNAYLYRDWVIQALNEDVPYDRFVRLQLAADLMDPPEDENLAALGFLGLGPKYYRRSAPEVMADEWEDRVDTVARGLLGITVACARCHDHKYDPIPTDDYYALAGVFASTEMFNRPLNSKPKDGNGQAKKPEDALHIVRDAKPRDLNVFVRGDINNKGPLAPRRFLQVLSPPGETFALRDRSGRLQLAEAIVAADNPLTARVFVNRAWALNFGQPLVGTPSNFGRLGQRPTHPKLLDDLAVRFMQSGWSIKWLQREMVLSATYRQNSHIDPVKQRLDPANWLLGRMNRRRLDVESWRDAILAAAGRLQRTIGGRSINPETPTERRRTLYSRVSRLDLNRMLALFDFPDPNAHSAQRSRTTTPLQKLFVLNSPFMVHQADALAKRLSDEVRGGDAARIRRAYVLLYGREVTEEELRLGLAYLGEPDAEQASRWLQYAQVLLASNEMLIVD